MGCEDGDVSAKCSPGQAISSDTQQSCVCQKCMDGWTGSQCEINSNVETTLSPTATPTTQPIECEDKPSDKFFYKTTKGKNKKPIYKKCKWLANKSQQKIGQICGKMLNLMMVPVLLKIPVRYCVELVQASSTNTIKSSEYSKILKRVKS